MQAMQICVTHQFDLILPNMIINFSLQEECKLAGSVDAESIDLEKKASFMVAQAVTEENEREGEKNLQSQV